MKDMPTLCPGHLFLCLKKCMPLGTCTRFGQYNILRGLRTLLHHWALAVCRRPTPLMGRCYGG